MNKTIVAFAAHPDDLEFTSNSTLSKLKNEGYEIIYVIITNGENGFKFNGKIDRLHIRYTDKQGVNLTRSPDDD